jgi:hypothetical protein
MANAARVRTLVAELDKLAKEYVSARDDYESTRQVFEAAREKLAAVRKVAPEVLGGDWHLWTRKHPEVALVGLDIGEAIIAVLQSRAYASAHERIQSLKKPPGEQREYDPFLTPTQLIEELDAQGFEFKTAAPRRELHAALLNLKGVIKNPKQPWPEYAVEDHVETYRGLRTIYGLPADESDNEEITGQHEEPSLFAEEEVGAAKDDDVPF